MVYRRCNSRLSIDPGGAPTVSKSRPVPLPPYASYATWQRLMDAFNKFLPEQLDTSYWRQLRLSGSSAKSLRLAVQHLRLIDDKYVVQDKLRRLVRASHGEGQESKSRVLTQVLSDAYPALFEPEGKLA